jgi:hypothetical protein
LQIFKGSNPRIKAGFPRRALFRRAQRLRDASMLSVLRTAYVREPTLRKKGSRQNRISV